MNWLALLGFVVLTLAVGGVAGWATRCGVADWYPHLRKPWFNPPAFVFAPVWTVLYILMAIAAWRVWARLGIASPALLLFLVQLAFNTAWSVIFFNAHRIGAALAELAALWALVLATTIAFWQVDPVAGILFLPYLAWSTFAAVLNAAVWRLNPATAP
jgi:tryptophan-rich sensory protein